MKNFTLTLLVAAATIGFSMSTNAQATGTATATGTIVTPISIIKDVDMNFGNIAVSSTAGTVELTPAGVRNPTGGVTLPATTGSVAAASFTVNGEGAYTYSIVLPASHTIELSTDATKTMTVDGFSSTPSVTGALSAGTQTLNVGATLNIAGGQTAGTYTSNATNGGFDVTVNYN